MRPDEQITYTIVIAAKVLIINSRATPDKKTAYSIYSKDAAQRKQQNLLAELYPRLPDEKYDIIYADPPWDYNGKMQFDKTSAAVERFDVTKKVFISAATFKYPTLKLAELKKLPVRDISAENALLFMWTSSPHLTQAIELGKAWGFEYRTVAFVWDKMMHNPGKYTLSNCELCLVFKHGLIPQPRGARNIKQLVRAPRREHSEKPEEVRNAIFQMFPTQKRVELFARSEEETWDAWGLDVFEDHRAAAAKRTGQKSCDALLASSIQNGAS